VKVRRLRSGELLALAGAILLVVSFTRPWYEGGGRDLDAWQTFGPAVLLLILAALAGLALALATVTERSTALPVAAAIWGTLFGILGTIAAIVRVLERPSFSTTLCAGAWLALAGAVAVLAGSWQSMRDERTHRYEPTRVEPRPPPYNPSP
jgi:H+/Cl- antiporter ClcA